MPSPAKAKIAAALLLFTTTFASADAGSDPAETAYQVSVDKAQADHDDKVKQADAALARSLAAAKEQLLAKLRAELGAAVRNAESDRQAVLRGKIAAAEGDDAVNPAAPGPSRHRIINLIPLIDAEKDAQHGTWMVKNGELYSDMAPASRLQLPYHPPLEYDFKIEFTRVKGGDDVEQMLAENKSAFYWLMGAWGNSICGFGVIAGSGPDGNFTTIKARNVFANGIRYVSVVKVRKDHVTAVVNGKQIADWKTNYLDMTNDHPLKDEKCLGVGCWESAVIFHKVEVTEVTGNGEVLRGATNAPK